MPLDNLIDGFVQGTAERARRLVGTVVSRVSDKYDARGPLEAFNQNKFQISKMQYPLNLGGSADGFGAGPNLAYIKFNILKSVGVEGDSSASAFGGAVNETKRNSDVERILNQVKGVARSLGADLSTIVGPETRQAAEKASKFVQDSGLSPGQFTTQRRIQKPTDIIALYMPHTMVFSQTNTYNPYSYTQQLGAALALGQSAAAGLRGDFGGAVTAGVEAATRKFIPEDTRAALLYSFQGRALNPQIEVIYQETPLRTFQFEFILAARSREEDRAIEQIIAAFRGAAAPSFAGTEGGRYLIPPDEFDIEFYFSGRQMEKIPKISTCVLTSIITDFAPSGQSTFFENGSPMSVRLALEFTETEIITKEKLKRNKEI